MTGKWKKVITRKCIVLGQENEWFMTRKLKFYERKMNGFKTRMAKGLILLDTCK